MSPEMQQALQEAYARRTNGAQMPQSGAPQQPTQQPAAPTQQPAQTAPSGFTGGTEGVPSGNGVSIDSNHEIEKIAATALAKRLNSASKVA